MRNNFQKEEDIVRSPRLQACQDPVTINAPRLIRARCEWAMLIRTERRLLKLNDRSVSPFRFEPWVEDARCATLIQRHRMSEVEAEHPRYVARTELLFEPNGLVK